MNFLKKCVNQKWFPYTVASCSAVLLFLGVSHINLFFQALGTLGKYFSPVITGLILAYVVHPLVAFFEKTILSGIKQAGIKRSIAILLSVAIIILFIAILMIALIPQLVDSVTNFVSNLDGYAASLESLLNKLSTTAGKYHVDLSGITEKINTFLSQFAQKLPAAMSQIINVSAGIGQGFFTFILGFILAIYFLAGKEKLLYGTTRLMKLFVPTAMYERMSIFWSTCNDILKRYIAGDILDGLLVGIINWLFMIITGMSYSVLISLFVGVTNLAPTFGPIVGAIIGGFILVLVNPLHALIFLIFTIVLQTMDGYVIKPKLFGNTLGVSSVWILVTLVVGGRMFGIAGIMLAIPFAAIFNFTYQNWIQKKEALLASQNEPPKEE